MQQIPNDAMYPLYNFQMKTDRKLSGKWVLICHSKWIFIYSEYCITNSNDGVIAKPKCELCGRRQIGRSAAKILFIQVYFVFIFALVSEEP